MSTRLIVIAAILLVALMLPIASSRLGATPVSLKVGALGGMTHPQGMLGNVYATGWQVGGYAWVSGPAVGLRLQTDYHRMKRTGTLFGTPRYSGKYTLTAVLLQMTFSPVMVAPLKPYAIIGGGTVNSKFNDYDETYDESYEHTSRDGAFSFGGGLRFPIRKVSVLIEAQYLIVFEKNDSLKMLMLTAGLGLSVL
jgi:hypothetical protein